jgi:[ribosomal protein S5]-alanine N-acetyltransferase
MVINTDRFQLKRLTINDVTEKYLSWFGGSVEVERYIDFAQKKADIDELVRYVKDRESRENVLFLGVFSDVGDHIGNIKYEPINLKDRSATMGILIGDKEWRGKGVAAEVIRASSEYLNKTYGIKYIDLGVDKNNAPAVSAYKKMKFDVVEENDNEFKMRLDLK